MNIFSKLLVSNAKSLVSSEIKGAAKKLLFKIREKSDKEIEQEIISKIGYMTHHYDIKKDQRIVFKPSAIFFNEWLKNSSKFDNKLIKDEETGRVYLDKKELSPGKKADIINQFSRMTDIKTAGTSAHLEGALRLMDPVSYTSIRFAEEFAGWDKDAPSIIDTWIDNVFGDNLISNREFSSGLFRKWIIGTLKRAVEPGAPLDGCLLLKGPPAIGKTSFFRNLVPEPFSERTGEITCNAKNPQKFVENIVGKTVACFDELSVLDYPRSVEIFKQLLSSQYIDVRLPYRRDPTRYNLRQGFSATTNRAKFISDDALSRRLWVIEIGDKNRINFDYLKKNRKALFQEALYRAQSGEQYLLTVEEQEQLEAGNRTFAI